MSKEALLSKDFGAVNGREWYRLEVYLSDLKTYYVVWYVEAEATAKHKARLLGRAKRAMRLKVEGRETQRMSQRFKIPEGEWITL